MVKKYKKLFLFLMIDLLMLTWNIFDYAQTQGRTNVYFCIIFAFYALFFAWLIGDRLDEEIGR